MWKPDDVLGKMEKESYDLVMYIFVEELKLVWDPEDRQLNPKSRSPIRSVPHCDRNGAWRGTPRTFSSSIYRTRETNDCKGRKARAFMNDLMGWLAVALQLQQAYKD